jgi:hypothetical protein
MDIPDTTADLVFAGEFKPISAHFSVIPAGGNQPLPECGLQLVLANCNPLKIIWLAKSWNSLLAVG